MLTKPHLSKPRPRFWRERSGQITLEAAMTLPVILLATFVLLAVAVYYYQQSSLYYNAGRSAERTAYIWDNSSKNYVTGAVHPTASDGLYWRIASDGVSQWFNVLHPFEPIRVQLPQAGKGTNAANGAVGKLERASGELGSELQGGLSYQHYGLFRVVRSSLERTVRLPDFAHDWFKGSSQLHAGTSSHVIDPVETIRLTDLTRTFISEIQGRIKPKAALELMIEPVTGPAKKPVITNHNQAADYLRKLVNGKEKPIKVSSERTRLVDALDASGVAHQAYFNFKEKQVLEEQLPKDIELLKSGKVKGVVWHFFKTNKQDKVKLSASFRREIERNGIIIVIHE
ncbi:TadE/TadG family type IV pilus assembly protein [Paenibacillus filicis]|uniref:TadE/TadG family type IV pilus assembly protein n=1 Tax=Paenibacillus filicis TaxID=669464 RepID=A0ABU9DII0_9BACL